MKILNWSPNKGVQHFGQSWKGWLHSLPWPHQVNFSLAYLLDLIIALSQLWCLPKAEFRPKYCFLRQNICPLPFTNQPTFNNQQTNQPTNQTTFSNQGQHPLHRSCTPPKVWSLNNSLFQFSYAAENNDLGIPFSSSILNSPSQNASRDGEDGCRRGEQNLNTFFFQDCHQLDQLIYTGCFFSLGLP